jgi:protein TonB
MAADGASGTVTVRLTVTRSGALADLSIAASSGNAALDEAALKAVRAAGRFPAAPEGLSQGRSYDELLFVSKQTILPGMGI